MSSTPTPILTCGLPGSGKTTLDVGRWSRAEPDELRTGTTTGSRVEFHVVDAPVDEPGRRVEARNAGPPWDRGPITRAHLDEWVGHFARPGPEEQALFDGP